MEPSDHDSKLRAAFTAQAESFNASAVANAGDVLDAIVALCEPTLGQRWLEAACGPGIVARRLAPLTGSVEGIDLTAEMIDLARREASAAGTTNASFSLGDATAIDRPSGYFDGAVTRFSVHHLAAPERLITEMARVVRPGGRIVVVDHVADDDADAAIWSTGIERLRDPSHWSCLTAQGLRTLGDAAGLTLESEQLRHFELDFEDWIARGGADEASRDLIEATLARRPPSAESFRVRGPVGHRTLTLSVWFGVWIR